MKHNSYPEFVRLSDGRTIPLLESPIAKSIHRFSAVIRTRKTFSANDCRRNGALPQNLRKDVQSNELFVFAERFEWVLTWPGTRGPRGMRFSVAAQHAKQIRVWGDLLTGFGKKWEDIHCHDAHGLASYSITENAHVGVADRIWIPGSTAKLGIDDAEARPVDPEVVRYLLTPPEA